MLDDVTSTGLMSKLDLNVIALAARSQGEVINNTFCQNM